MICAAVVALFCGSATARAEGIGWHYQLEGGIAVPIDPPRKAALVAGGEAALRGGVTLLRFMDLHLTLGFLGLAGDHSLPSEKNFFTGGGLRFIAPRDQGYSALPWVGGEALYIRNDLGNHVGYSVAVGVLMPLKGAPGWSLGAFLRYMQTVRSRIEDGKTIIAGLDLEHASCGRCQAPPPADTDGDGVPDDRDRCPREPGPPGSDGCPPATPAPPPDSDHDGVPDSADKCPNEAGPAERQGCPEHDRDHDGVPDSEDACPDQAGTAATKGCPDGDQDGVPDKEDNCPEKAGPVSNQGCPEYKAVKVTHEKIEIAEKVHFANAQSKILSSSFTILDEVAKVLTENPSVQLSVEGHTDDKGKAEKNQKLSEARAQAVVDYLVKKGVGKERLTAKGFGPTMPIGDNKTAEGREQNRRVDFVVTSR